LCFNLAVISHILKKHVQIMVIQV